MPVYTNASWVGGPVDLLLHVRDVLGQNTFGPFLLSIIFMITFASFIGFGAGRAAVAAFYFCWILSMFFVVLELVSPIVAGIMFMGAIVSTFFAYRSGG